MRVVKRYLKIEVSNVYKTETGYMRELSGSLRKGVSAWSNAELQAPVIKC